MAIADLAAYKAALTSGAEFLPVSVGNLSTNQGRWSDNWTLGPPAGVAPTTGVVPTNDTLGALGQRDGGSGTLAILGARYNSLAPGGNFLIVDRLSHQGGLVANIATEQTTNLPTAALTRHTSGEGVMMGLTIYTAIGSTPTTVTASYTNQAGTSGRTTSAVAIGGTNFSSGRRFILLPLQAGDTGVRAVASVTLAATTGTVGNMGVTLFKPLYVIFVESTSGVMAGGFVTGGVFGGIPEIIDGACLCVFALVGSGSGDSSGALLLTEH